MNLNELKVRIETLRLEVVTIKQNLKALLFISKNLEGRIAKLEKKKEAK